MLVHGCVCLPREGPEPSMGLYLSSVDSPPCLQVRQPLRPRPLQLLGAFGCLSASDPHGSLEGGVRRHSAHLRVIFMNSEASALMGALALKSMTASASPCGLSCR